MIYANNSDSARITIFSAIEFVLEWCVQNFTTSVTYGLSSTEKHGSIRNFYLNANATYIIAKPDDGDNRVYMISTNNHNILGKYFQTQLQGTVDSLYGSRALEVSNDATQALFNPFNFFRGNIDGVDPNPVPNPGRGLGQAGLQRILDNIATGMTNT